MEERVSSGGKSRKRRESWKSLFLRVKESGAKLVLKRGRRVYFVFEKQKRNVSKEEGLKS